MADKPTLWQYANILPKYTELGLKMRGHVINETIKLERSMDAFIASHFCYNDEIKRTELMLLILCTERMIFEGKRQVAKWIAETYHSDLIKMGEQMHDGKMFKNIQEIGEFRNLLAHNYLDIDDFVKDEKANQITLKKYKNKIETIKITGKMMKEKIQMIHSYMNVFTHWHYPYNLPL